MTQPKYKLYYWPLPFRGSFISYYLAYNNIPFVKENSFEEIGKLKNMPPSDQPIPFMGPPVLVNLKTKEAISQMPAILMHLSDNKLTHIDLKIIMDCNDILMELVRYNGSHMWEREKWIEFRANRLPRWMQIFEESLKRGDISTNNIGITELSVFALFGNMIRCFPSLEDECTMYAPSIEKLCNKIAQDKNISKLVKQQKQKYGDLYCGGQIEKSIRLMLKLDNEKGTIND